MKPSSVRAYNRGKERFADLMKALEREQTRKNCSHVLRVNPLCQLSLETEDRENL